MHPPTHHYPILSLLALTPPRWRGAFIKQSLNDTQVGGGRKITASGLTLERSVKGAHLQQDTVAKELAEQWEGNYSHCRFKC